MAFKTTWWILSYNSSYKFFAYAYTWYYCNIVLSASVQERLTEKRDAERFQLFSEDELDSLSVSFVPQNLSRNTKQQQTQTLKLIFRIAKLHIRRICIYKESFKKF